MEETREERNARLARKVIRALEKGDGRTFKEMLPPDAKVWISGDVIFSRTLHKGSDMYGAFDEVGGESGRPWPYTIKDVTAQDDRVSVRVDSMTRMPSGKLYNNNFHFLFKFKDDGTIYEWYEHGDSEMITWALCDGNRPYPPLTDEQRIERFIREREEWPQGDDAVKVSPADFE